MSDVAIAQVPAAAADPYAGIDASAAQSGFVRQLPDGRHEAWIAIDGMVCAACAHTVEAAVARLPGVESVRVALMTQRARVLWHGSTTPSDMFRAIAASGYTPYPADSVEFEAARRQASRLLLWRLLVACGAMMQVMMYAAPEYFTQPGDISPDLLRLLRWAQWMLTLPVMLFCAWPILGNAWNSLRHGRIGMDVPAALGIGLAFGASSVATFSDHGHVWFDSVTMFVFFLLLARWLEDRARRQATLRLEALQRSLPGTVARLHRADAPDTGPPDWVTPDALQPGDRIQVDAGMAFPVDGTVHRGHTQADEALLTGESRPIDKPPGSAVKAGSMNVLAPVQLIVTRVAADSTLGQIRALVDAAASARPDWMRTADRWATVFLVGVLVIAAGAWGVWQWLDPDQALSVAIAILIVTCPCALSLATPSAMLAATAALARRGIWLRTPQALEPLARASQVVFDKTGTLTEGQPTLSAIDLLDASQTPDGALRTAARLSHWSQHPLSRTLTRQAGPVTPAEQVVETAGGGLSGTLEGVTWWLGSATFLTEHAGLQRAPDPTADDDGWPATWLAGPHGIVARFRFADPVRADAATTLAQLRRGGLQPCLLSGDSAAAVARLAGELGLAQATGGLSPTDKLTHVQRWQAAGHCVVMTGDGINDGPALAAADVAVVLGDATPLARQQADVVLASGRLSDLTFTHRMAGQAVRIMRQNLAWALAYNITSIPLAMVGYMPPWAAGLGMALSSLLVIGNGLRLLHAPQTPAAAVPAPVAATSPR